MKRFLVTAMLAIACTSLHAQKGKAAIEKAVWIFFEGLSDLSETSLKSVTTPDFILLEDGMVWNLDSLTSKFAQMKAVTFKRINKLDFIRTDQKGNIAWVNYFNTAEFTANGRSRTVKWLESAVLTKEKDGWKIAQLHSTVIKKS